MNTGEFKKITEGKLSAEEANHIRNQVQFSWPRQFDNRCPYCGSVTRRTCNGRQCVKCGLNV